MNMQRSSCALVIVLIATQVLGPAALWAAEQESVRVEASNRVLISAISGEQLTAQSTSGLKTLHFGDNVGAGDQIATGNNTVADVLIGNRAVVTLGQDTIAELTTVSSKQTTIQVTQGIVRVTASAAALGEQGRMIIQTPTGQVQTHGGIVRVMVNAPVGSAGQTPAGEVKPYLTSYAPNPMVAALNTRGDIIQVEEGTAEIPGAGPDGEALTLNAGQSVTLQSGQASAIAELEPQKTMRADIVAKADHTKTPKEGLEHLVALQVDQATQLGQALTSTEKTGQDESENIINGATGGVQLASTLVNTLFGRGTASNPVTSNPTESTGSGFVGQFSDADGALLTSTTPIKTNVNGPKSAENSPQTKALLVFTSKDPLDTTQRDDLGELKPLDPVMSEFTVVKELVLVGGTPNDFHEGIAPTETLIIRGINGEVTSPPLMSVTNQAEGPSPERDPAVLGGFFPSSTFPDITPFGDDIPSEIVQANSTFVVQSFESTITAPDPNDEDRRIVVGRRPGTFDQFTRRSISVAGTSSTVDGAITATSSTQVPVITLTGGVTLDRGTLAIIGTTAATDNYFKNNNLETLGATFDGSLLAVIDGPNNVPTAVTVQDRLLGVYDGSTINTDGGNKALLSVLDAKLTGPTDVPLIDIDAAFKDADVNNGEGSGGSPEVTVTSAVVTRSTMKLDGALLEASAPLLALTQAMMTTTSHFADLAGNLAPSIKLDDALIALNASQLLIQNGHLLNLNDATATMNGYLFSLNNGSQLQLNNGTLFSLNNGSSLNLNANAFGVFGSGTNTLNITNNLCAAMCGNLVNSANTPFMLNGSALQVAGVTQNVVLPNSFNVFATAPNAQPVVNISQNAAVFQVDSTSTLTINGTAVVKP